MNDRFQEFVEVILTGMDGLEQRLFQRMDMKLDERLVPIELDIRELKTDVHVLKIDVSELTTDVSEIKTDVAILKVDVTELKTNISILKIDVSELKTDAAILKVDVRDLKTDMSEVKSDIREIRQDLEGGLKAIDSHALQLFDHNKRIGRLEKRSA